MKNKGADLPKKVKLDKKGKAVSKGSSYMSNWLVKKKERSDNVDQEKAENGNLNEKTKEEKSDGKGRIKEELSDNVDQENDVVVKKESEESKDEDADESPSKKPKK